MGQPEGGNECGRLRPPIVSHSLLQPVLNFGVKIPEYSRSGSKSPFEVQNRMGGTIRRYRQQQGLTQEELAWRAGLHRTYLADIERGRRNITVRVINNLARALKVSIAHLLAPPEEVQSVPKPGEILLVEDNPVDAELTLRAFKQAKLTNPVRHVRDGEEALVYLFGSTDGGVKPTAVLPQLILLDLNLPKVSGMEVLRVIKSRPRTRHIPVVILTVSQSDQNIIECGRLGAANYIVKPVLCTSLRKVPPRLGLPWALVTQPAMPQPRATRPRHPLR